MNDEKPLVSVLMTAYNREKFISEAIESVLKSTWLHFELLIVDDGSSDATVSIARSYEQKDARVKVYQNEKNLGDYFNRNKAASYASGKYLKYVDSDDIIYPNSLAIFVSAMEQFPEAAVGIMSITNQEEKPYPFLMTPTQSYHYHFYKSGLFDSGPSGLIFHTARFREMGGFTGKRFVGDTEINLRLAALWPVVKIASSLVFWRQHEGQEIVAGHNSTGYLELQLPVFTEELNKKDCPLSKKERESILNYYRKTSARQILNIAMVKKKPQLALKLFRKLSLNINDLINAVLFIKKKY